MVMECVDMVYTTLSDIVGMNSVYKVQKAVAMNYTINISSQSKMYNNYYRVACISV